ncbi:MAG: 16S rRNA (guanine(966)-N(2))-methyltransferase RsmD [Bacilli bacterium]|nr:16S rRNA (guanine(966)-N(2))-methyltransferase RsmD [Bacilli bacterium]
MRIIAGINRGRKLQTLEGLSTRPTLDGTKEAIFSSLGGMLPGFVVLDVFGGSGALSLESISRGAKKAYILDNNLDAIEIIKKNAQTLNSMKELTILYGDYKQIIKRFDKSKMFDIIFLDPPFKLKVIDELIIYIIENDLLAEGGYIVCEYPKEDVVQKHYDGYKVKLCRRYSSSEVLILEKE